jgi:uncharacterized protein YjdB
MRSRVILLAAAIFAAACSGGYDVGSTTGTSTGTQAITVTVAPTSALMAIGERITVLATVSGGPTNSPRTVSWSSSDTTKATVSATGDVTALAKGNVFVTATSTANTQKAATATITISP